MHNKAKNQIVILGSGTSTGVPIITCNCSVCQSNEPKDNRTRMSIFLQTAKGNNILVDTSPDIREQLLRERITHLDAVIITHAHADHIAGLDDLRAFTFNREKPLPLYANKQTATILKRKFDYIFEPFTVFKDGKAPGGKVAKLELIEISPKQEHNILGDNFYFDQLPHGIMQTLSFIHKSFAYMTDGSKIPEDYLRKLSASKLKYALIDCAAQFKHPTHMFLEQSAGYAKAIGAQKTGLIHLGHAHSHNELQAEVDKLNLSETTLFPSYDGAQFFY